MAQEQFQRVKQKQNPSAESSEEDRDSAVTACPETMRSEIRRMKLEKTFGEQGTLSQAVVRIVNEAASDQRQWKTPAEAERRRSERDQQSEINWARGKQPDRDSVEQHPPVQDPGAQARQKQ